MKFRVDNQNLLLPMLIQVFQSDGIKKESHTGQILHLKESLEIEFNFSSSVQPVLTHSYKSYNPFYVFAYTINNLLNTSRIDRLLRMSKKILHHVDLNESSTDTSTLYGKRIYEQINKIVDILSKYPTYKQAIVEVWSKNLDLGNVHRGNLPTIYIQFMVKQGYLTMNVYDHANDLLSDFFGYEATYLAYLHALVAFRLNLPLGYSNYHISFPFVSACELESIELDQSARRYICDRTFPVVGKDAHLLMIELDMFWHEGVCMGTTEPFIRKVARPIIAAWDIYNSLEAPNRYTQAEQKLVECQSLDWQIRCQKWLDVRFALWKKAHE